MKKAAPRRGDGQHGPAGQSLSREHLKKIYSSALDNSVVSSLQWRSKENGDLEIDYLKPNGSCEECKDGSPFRRWRMSDVKLQQARARGEKPAKYRSPRENGCRLYHSHYAIALGGYRERLVDKYVVLRITEGELKTEAANLHDPERLTIGLGGVSSWRDHRSGADESQPLPELVEIPLEGREVRLCFDSDLDKPQVSLALKTLAEWLANQGADVRIEILPNGLDGSRLGLDDLIERHGAAVFQQIAQIARSPFKKVRKQGKEELVWSFHREPASTRERNVYLYGLHGQHWRSSDDGKDHWQHWCGTHWEAVHGDDDLARLIEEFAALQGWENRELNTVRSLMAAFRRSIGEPAGGEGIAGLVPFLNGCLRLPDRELISHDPKHGNTWSLPFAYDPSAHCEQTQAFLLDRLGDQTAVMVVRAFCRSLLCRERLKCFLEITGPSNTGKSVIANLLQAMVGSENTAAMILQRLEDRQQRFETLKLRNRRLVVFSECHDYVGCLNNLKAITGGDAISAEIKGGRHLDLTFHGGVVLVGNAPVRASDPSGAVVNRRRSLLVHKVVQSREERCLLESDGNGGWKGELAGELAGLVNWSLAMQSSEARAALARDMSSPARMEAELETLLRSDLLAAWADEALVWDETEGVQTRVGRAKDDCQHFLYANYRRWFAGQGLTTRPISVRRFKEKLVDLLRDTLGLPLPAGLTNSGLYKVSRMGSVVPFLRIRLASDEGPGVIRTAFLQRLQARDAEQAGTDTKRIGDDQTPVGNGWNGWNGFEIISHKAESELDCSFIGEGTAESVSSVSSIPQRGSQHSISVADGMQVELLMHPSAPVGSGADACCDEDDPAWGPRPLAG